MVRPSPRCRCGSGRKKARCCGPVLAGQAAPSPLALMRSRYAAYAAGQLDHIIASTAPDGPIWQEPVDQWRAELADYVAATRFAGLRIVAAPPAAGDEGTVHFVARLVQGGVAHDQEERSRFVRQGGRWLYWGPRD